MRKLLLLLLALASLPGCSLKPGMTHRERREQVTFAAAATEALQAVGQAVLRLDERVKRLEASCAVHE